MSHAGTCGPLRPMKGSPKNSANCFARRNSTNPTAIWLRRSAMPENATTPAITIDTAIAATNPIKRLFVVAAVAKPVIAESRMLPSSDRFTTPAFSVIVSPTTA